MTKKVYESKMFFLSQLIIQTEILTNNLVTLKRWDGIKDDKF